MKSTTRRALALLLGAFLLVVVTTIDQRANAGDYSLTATSAFKTSYVLSPGVEPEHRAVSQSDITGCTGRFCLNLWVGQTVRQPGNNNESSGNEVDITPSYSTSLGKLGVYAEYAYYARLKRGGSDLHSALVRFSYPLPDGFGVYLKGQAVEPTKNGGDLPNGGTLLFFGLTNGFDVGRRLHLGFTVEGVRDDGVAGDEVGWVGRYAFSPSINFGTWSLDLGAQHYHQWTVTDRGNHTVWSAGVTWRIKSPKPVEG